MKKTYNYFVLKYMVLIFLIGSFSACNKQENENNGKPNRQQIDSISQVENSQNGKAYPSVVYTKYKLPLPVELYRALKDENLLFNEAVITPIESIDHFSTEVTRAINLGFYSSDLAYCTVFEQNKKAVEYFTITKEISEMLGLSKGYNEKMVKRFKDNIDNSDSLYRIATISYWTTCNYLEETQDVNYLPFIIVGSYIESLHLTAKTYTGEAPQQDEMIRIARQRRSLDNLIEYIYNTMIDIKVFKENIAIQKISKQLNDLGNLFNQLDQNTEQVITDEQFNAIASEIEKIRRYYLNK